MCTDELMDIVEEGDWREFVPVDEDLGQSAVDPKTGKSVDFDPKQTSNYKYFKSFTRTLSKQLFDWFIHGGKDVVVVAFNKEGLKRLRNCQLRPFTIHQYSQSIKAKDNEFEERLYSKNESVEIQNVDDIVNCVYFTEYTDKSKKADIKKRLAVMGVKSTTKNFGKMLR